MLDQLGANAFCSIVGFVEYVLGRNWNPISSAAFIGGFHERINF